MTVLKDFNEFKAFYYCITVNGRTWGAFICHPIDIGMKFDAILILQLIFYIKFGEY